MCTPVSAVTSNSLALFGECQVYKKYVFGIKKKWLQTILVFLTVIHLLLRALQGSEEGVPVWCEAGIKEHTMS